MFTIKSLFTIMVSAALGVSLATARPDVRARAEHAVVHARAVTTQAAVSLENRVTTVANRLRGTLGSLFTADADLIVSADSGLGLNAALGGAQVGAGVNAAADVSVTGNQQASDVAAQTQAALNAAAQTQAALNAAAQTQSAVNIAAQQQSTLNTVAPGAVSPVTANATAQTSVSGAVQTVAGGAVQGTVSGSADTTVSLLGGK